MGRKFREQRSVDDDRAQQSSSRSAARTRAEGATRRTILIALVANSVIAAAKLAGGLISGSTALLAEAAHSAADTTNQAFLLVSITLGGRDPDELRPFGHGQERFLWSFVAAVGMFLAGAVFAIGYGAYELFSGASEEGGFAVAWVVLAVSGVSEAVSWIRALRQTRSEAQQAGKPLREHVRASRDPSVKMVLFEDSAALLGIAIAAAGIGLHQLTGAAAWDQLASILIGLMLVAVALKLARDAKHLVVGASARPDERRAIEEAIEAFPEVRRVVELLTMVLAPKALLVAARADLRNDIDAERVESVSEEIERAVREAVPDVTEVFLDATPGRRESADAPTSTTRDQTSSA
jgi:cation diffusion facilitator family transporter